MPAPRIADLRSKIEASIRELQEKDARISVRAVCQGVCSPQTLYDYDKSVGPSESLRTLITNAAARQEAVAKRVKRRRGAAADAALIEKLRAEVTTWRERYETVLEQVTLMEFHLKGHKVDVGLLYQRGMLKPDRSVSKAGLGKAGARGRARGVRLLSE